jgi:hypothetical protein
MPTIAKAEVVGSGVFAGWGESASRGASGSPPPAAGGPVMSCSMPSNRYRNVERAGKRRAHTGTRRRRAEHTPQLGIVESWRADRMHRGNAIVPWRGSRPGSRGATGRPSGKDVLILIQQRRNLRVHGRIGRGDLRNPDGERGFRVAVRRAGMRARLGSRMVARQRVGLLPHGHRRGGTRRRARHLPAHTPSTALVQADPLRHGRPQRPARVRRPHAQQFGRLGVGCFGVRSSLTRCSSMSPTPGVATTTK